MAIYEYWLDGYGHSQRAVAYRQLLPDEVDTIGREAAGAGAGMTALSYQLEYEAIGVRRMLVAYSEPFATEPPFTEKTIWTPVDPVNLELGWGKGKIFTAKDVVVLKHLFKSLHEVRISDAERAMGKVRTRAD